MRNEYFRSTAHIKIKIKIKIHPLLKKELSAKNKVNEWIYQNNKPLNNGKVTDQNYTS